MPILEGATYVEIGNSTFREIAGDVYDFRGEDSKKNPIQQLHELSLSDAIYNFTPTSRAPIDTGGCLRAIQDWMAEKSVPILLLSGPQGTGKSTFARAIAYACVHKANIPVVSFCFTPDHPQLSDLHRVIPTLAVQLHKINLRGLKETIEVSINVDPFIWSRPLSKQFVELIIRPIRASVNNGAHNHMNFVILLDGIDACRDYGALKQFLSDIKANIADEVYYGRIKILCTSRDVPDVHAAFRSLINYYRHISTQPSAKNNVLKYLNDATQDLRQTTQFPWDPINNYIANKSEGNLEIAAVILQRIRATNIRNIGDIQAIIDQTSAQPPSPSNSFREPRRRDTRSVNDTSPLTNTSPLDILLKILQNKKPDEAMIAVVSPGTINFMADLLSTNDYVKIPSKITDPQDSSNLLDFIFYLLDNNLLYAETLRDGNRRARRLMLKLGLGAYAIPQSVLINKDEVQMNSNMPMEYGGFASVHEGFYRGNRVAIKRLRCPVGHQNFDQKPFIREVLTWRTLSHDYVLPFVGTYEDSGFIHLVSPFMENGTLGNWRNEKNPSSSEVEIMILRVAEGVQYLHYEGVIHCDLRGTNILLDSNLQVRIADFGLSRDSNATATNNTTASKNFAAPELLVDEDEIRHTEKTDIYAFGCLYYEIHFNSLPFGTNAFYAVQQVKEGKRPPRKPDPPLGDEAWNLIGRCWDQDPGRRPTMDEVAEIMVSWPR